MALENGMKNGKLAHGLAALFLGVVVSIGGADIAMSHQQEQEAQDIDSDHFFRQYNFRHNESDYQLILLFGAQARKNLLKDPVDETLEGFDLINELKKRGAVYNDARTKMGGLIPAYQKTDRKERMRVEINFDHGRENDPRPDRPAWRKMDLSKLSEPVIEAVSFERGEVMFTYDKNQLAELNKYLRTMLAEITADGNQAGGKPMPGARVPQP
jgi:hypothetical protein